MLLCRHALEPYYERRIAKEIVNLDEVILKLVQEIQNPPNPTQEAMRLHNLLSLPHLPPKHIRGKDPLIDYSWSHVVTFVEYLYITRKNPWTRQLQRKSNNEKERKERINKPKNNKFGDYNRQNSYQNC